MRTAIREGIRRIGEVVREQVSMYGTLTGRRSEPARVRPAVGLPATGAAGEARAPDAPGASDAPSGDELAKVLRLPAKRGRAG